MKGEEGGREGRGRGSEEREREEGWRGRETQKTVMTFYKMYLTNRPGALHRDTHYQSSIPLPLASRPECTRWSPPFAVGCLTVGLSSPAATQRFFFNNSLARLRNKESRTRRVDREENI